MKKFSIIALAVFISCFFAGCKKKETTEVTRSFYMGVTPWPADFTEAELSTSYSFINSNCDIVSHHFDEGIPYEEAYYNTGWPAGLISELKTRKTKTPIVI